MFLKIIDKLLKLKKKIVFNHLSSRVALVSYVLIPPLWLRPYFEKSHNNRTTSKIIVEVLVEMGYRVELYDCNDIDINISKKYDFFFGHTDSFEKILKQINLDGPKVFLLSGANPEFSNNAQKERFDYLYNRKNIKLKPIDYSIHDDRKACIEFSDITILIGNKFTLDTYPKILHTKIKTLNNNLNNLPAYSKNDKSRNFLFISSNGQIHRGLDILLDVFKDRKEKLYVCSHYEKESDFMQLYHKELYETNNIVPMGYQDLTSDEFNKILDDVTFVISLSCSEGQSGSVLNMMSFGLIPVGLESIGIDIVNCGFVVNNFEINTINSMLNKISMIEDSELKKMQTLLKNEILKYSYLNVKNNYKQIIGEFKNV